MTLVDCGEMFRPSNDLEVINLGTEYTIRVSEARKSQLEAVRSDLRGQPNTTTLGARMFTHL